MDVIRDEIPNQDYEALPDQKETGIEPESEKGSKPYDSAFKTLVNDCSRLLLPLINEVFGMDYDMKDAVIRNPTEHIINKPEGYTENRISDSSVRVVKEGHESRFLFECQSKPDNTMLVRIYEYIMEDALTGGTITDDKLEVIVPHAAVLYLRSSRSTPDQMYIRLNTPGGCVEFSVPSIKMITYTAEDIIKKDLYFLIPFYIFNYEKRFADYETDEVRLRDLEEEYRRIIIELDGAYDKGKITALDIEAIVDMSKLVLRSIASNYKKIRKGIGEIMGGEVLEYKAKTIYKEGFKSGWDDGRKSGWDDGIKSGQEEGRIKECIEMCREDLHMTDDETVEKLIKKFGVTRERAIEYVKQTL